MESKLCAWMVARRNKQVILTKNMCLPLARKWDSASDTLCGQRVCVVYGNGQMFLPTENCTSRSMFLRQTAYHRGWSHLPSPLPSLLPKLPNLVPNPQPKSAAKHAAQVAAKPAALLAAGEPIPVPPVEHVHVLRVKHFR